MDSRWNAYEKTTKTAREIIKSSSMDDDVRMPYGEEDEAWEGRSRPKDWWDGGGGAPAELGISSKGTRGSRQAEQAKKREKKRKENMNDEEDEPIDEEGATNENEWRRGARLSMDEGVGKIDERGDKAPHDGAEAGHGTRLIGSYAEYRQRKVDYLLKDKKYRAFLKRMKIDPDKDIDRTTVSLKYLEQLPILAVRGRPDPVADGTIAGSQQTKGRYDDLLEKWQAEEEKELEGTGDMGNVRSLIDEDDYDNVGYYKKVKIKPLEQAIADIRKRQKEFYQGKAEGAQDN
eukprot:GHVS01089471.1.p2 GENE.GHVS01089471.1~~GHVS01089471.1.p2  ORF type:complete len:289 (+),score=62.30 GHVS01089471.1:2502-3368(+)